MIDFKTFIEEGEMELLDEAGNISSGLAIRKHNQILKPLISYPYHGRINTNSLADVLLIMVGRVLAIYQITILT